MSLNFTNNLLINLTEWQIKPLKFDKDNNFINQPQNINPDNIFGFYGSEFQPFNQAPFWS